MTPSLTTVRLPMVEMGARALTLALGRNATETRTEAFPTEVVRRESTGPPPTAGTA